MIVKNESTVLIVTEAAVAGSYMNPAKSCDESKTPSSTYPTTRPWGCAAVGLPMVLGVVSAHPGIEKKVKTPSFRVKPRMPEGTNIETGMTPEKVMSIGNGQGVVTSSTGAKRRGH